jgi:serine/threonine protein kinase
MVTNIATPMNDIDATQHSFSLIEYKDIEDISLLDHSKREFTGVWRRIPVLLTEIATKAKPDILRQELMPLVKARHPHLVLFLGISCPSNGIICIVSERMDGGSLRAWLASDTMYNTPESKPASSSSWKDRITIAQQIAQGMNMLHQQKPHPIIHGKLSSLSVLLDDRLVAKVGGYGLSKIIALENNGQIEDPSWYFPLF